MITRRKEHRGPLIIRSWVSLRGVLAGVGVNVVWLCDIHARPAMRSCYRHRIRSVRTEVEITNLRICHAPRVRPPRARMQALSAVETLKRIARPTLRALRTPAKRCATAPERRLTFTPCATVRTIRGRQKRVPTLRAFVPEKLNDLRFSHAGIIA